MLQDRQPVKAAADALELHNVLQIDNYVISFFYEYCQFDNIHSQYSFAIFTTISWFNVDVLIEFTPP